jgi:hypothetical protein
MAEVDTLLQVVIVDDRSYAAFEAVVTKIAKAPKLTAEAIKEFVRRQRETES